MADYNYDVFENDILSGTSESDTITIGKATNATVDGGAGDDTITLHGLGDNFSTSAVVTGGEGADTFILMQPTLGATLTDLTKQDTLVLSVNSEVAAAKTDPRTKKANPLYKTDGRLSSLTATYSGSTLTLNGYTKQWKVLNLTLKNIKSVSSIANVKVYNGSVDGALNAKNLTTLGQLLAAGKPLASGAKAGGKNVVLSKSFKGAFNLANFAIGDYYFYGKNVTATASKQKLTITGDSRANLITGGAGNDTLRGGAGNDTLQGGAGNDRLTGDTGNDVFTYANGGGKDTITDYTAKQDTLYITGNAISKTALSGRNVVFTVGKGSVTLSGAKGKTISMKDNRGSYSLTSSAITLAAGFGGTMDASKYFSTVKTVDGRKTKKAVNLTGNASANKLYGNAAKNALNGGAGSDYLDGGAGNDVLTGGTGNDVFVYRDGDGADTIKDYEQGKDTLYLAKGAFKSTTASGKNLVFNVGKGKVTLNKAAGKTVTLKNASGGLYTMTKAALTAKSGFGGTMDARAHLSTVTTVNGAAATKASVLYGNGKANTVTGGNGSDKLYGLAGNDKLIGGKGNDSLDGGAGNDTLTGNAGIDAFAYAASMGKDVITDYAAGELLHITSGTIGKAALANKNKDIVFTVGSGSITLQKAGAKAVSLKDSRGNYTMTKTGLTLSSNFTGTLNAANYLSTIKTVDGRAATKTVTLYGNGKANVLYAGKAGGTLRGYAGNDTLYGGAGADTFFYDSGNDTIYNYTAGKDTIRFSAATLKSKKISGSDIVLTLTNGGTITVKNAANKTISYIDKSGSKKNITTIRQQDVIMRFMKYLDEATGKSSLDMLNGAVNYASYGLFTSWENLVNSFADDLQAHGSKEQEGLYLLDGKLVIGDATDKFLKNYCGINLANTDTGAITGADAGGSTKTAETIVPENGTIADVKAPAGLSTNINGLTFLWPEETNETQKAIVNRIYTWWAKGGLTLIEQSYGLSFKEAGTTVNTITVNFESSNDVSLAWVTPTTWSTGADAGKCTKLTLTVNMNYFSSIKLSDVNGYAGDKAGYLDRVLAHEFTHAVMAANINYFADLPGAVKEGLAELVHGIDDTRATDINILSWAVNADALRNNLQISLVDQYTYSGGYMLFRYFAKQVAENAIGTSTSSGMAASSSGMIANSAPIVGTSSAQLASLVSSTQTGSLGGLTTTGLASPDASGSGLIAASGTAASNPLANRKTA